MLKAWLVTLRALETTPRGFPEIVPQHLGVCQDIEDAERKARRAYDEAGLACLPNIETRLLLFQDPPFAAPNGQRTFWQTTSFLSLQPRTRLSGRDIDPTKGEAMDAWLMAIAPRVSPDGEVRPEPHLFFIGSCKTEKDLASLRREALENYWQRHLGEPPYEGVELWIACELEGRPRTIRQPLF